MPRKVEPKRKWSRGGWGPDFALYEDDERKLRGILDDDAFIERIRSAGAHYLLMYRQDDEQPGRPEVRAALDELDKNLQAFLFSIRNLDEKTASLIELQWHKHGGSVDDLRVRRESGQTASAPLGRGTRGEGLPRSRCLRLNATPSTARKRARRRNDFPRRALLDTRYVRLCRYPRAQIVRAAASEHGHLAHVPKSPGGRPALRAL